MDMRNSSLGTPAQSQHVMPKHRHDDFMFRQTTTDTELYLKLSQASTFNHSTQAGVPLQSNVMLTRSWDNVIGSDSLRAGTVRGSNLGGGRDIAHPSRPALGITQPPVHWVPGLFPRSKAVGALCWPPTSFSAKLKVEGYTSTHPLGHHGLLLGELFTLLHFMTASMRSPRTEKWLRHKTQFRL